MVIPTDNEFDTKDFTRTVKDHEISINDLRKKVLLKQDYAAFAECFKEASSRQKQIEDAIEKKVKHLIENNKAIGDLLKTKFNEFDRTKNYNKNFVIAKSIGTLAISILLIIIGAWISSKF